MNITDTPKTQPASLAEKAKLLTLEDLDGRTLAARRARALVDSIATDLGGDRNLTAAQRELVIRAAVIGALLQDRETRLLAGKRIGLGDYLSTVNAQVRVLTTLGLDRKRRDVTPRLGEYIGAKAA